MNLNISLAEARAEAVWLRTQMQQKGCMCIPSTFQEISDRLCKLLAYIAHKERQQKQLEKQASFTLNTQQINKTQNTPTMSYVYLSVILWYPTLQVSFALFTVLNSIFCQLFHPPKHSKCIKPLQYLCWPCFLPSVLFFFFWSKQYFLLAGGTVSNRPGLFQLGSPVRFSPSQFHIGIYLVETVLD